MIESRDAETCYYCENKAEYSQLVGSAPEEYAVSGVCAKHLEMGLNS